jgi:hypothetical protein
MTIALEVLSARDQQLKIALILKRLTSTARDVLAMIVLRELGPYPTDSQLAEMIADQGENLATDATAADLMVPELLAKFEAEFTKKLEDAKLTESQPFSLPHDFPKTINEMDLCHEDIVWMSKNKDKCTYINKKALALEYEVIGPIVRLREILRNEYLEAIAFVKKIRRN